MTRRLLGNPAVLVLAALAILGVVGVNWGIGQLVADQGMSWSGEPSEEQVWQLRISFIANVLPGPATLVAVTSVLGILAIGSAEHQRGTRTISAAGSTRNRAKTTEPNSSPRPEEEA